MHTCTHTRPHRHACPHTYTSTQAHVHSHTYTSTYGQTHAYLHTYTSTHTHIRNCTRTCPHMHGGVCFVHKGLISSLVAGPGQRKALESGANWRERLTRYAAVTATGPRSSETAASGPSVCWSIDPGPPRTPCLPFTNLCVVAQAPPPHPPSL